MRFFRAAYCWLDDRLGLSSSLGSILKHPVPPTGWSYVLGSAVLVAFIVHVVTCLALSFIYVPSPNSAYEIL